MYVRAQVQVANMRNETQGVRAAVNTLRALQPRTEAIICRLLLHAITY